MKILITGGAGFIGSNLAKSLINRNHEIRIFDNISPKISPGDGLGKLNKQVEFMHGDVRNIKDWDRALSGIEAIYHFAAAVGIGHSMLKPSYYLETNTIGTAKLYEVLLNKPEIRESIRRIIIPGSKTIYGEGTYLCGDCGVVYPVLRTKEQLERADWEIRCPDCGNYVAPTGTKENKPINPISIYALSKYDTENIAINYGFAFQIPTLIFRGFSIYGPGQSLSNPYSGVCSIFLSRIKNHKPPIIFEDGNQLRDYIFIEDTVDFLVKILGNKTSGTFNLGTGKPTRVLDIAENLIDISKSKVKPKITGEYRLGDNRHDFADISRIKDDFGFCPKFDIIQGLERLVEWGMENKAFDSFDESEKLRKRYFK